MVNQVTGGNVAEFDRDADATSRRRRRRAILISAAWLLIVSLFFGWQAITYQGFAKWAAEWEFGRFGTYYPIFTFLLFVGVCGLPVLIYWLSRRRKAETDALPEVRQGGRAIAASTRLMRILFWVAGGFAVSALVSLLLILTLPSEYGQIQQLTLGTPAALSPAEGRTALVGSVNYKTTAAFGEKLLSVRNVTHFAPIVARGAADSSFCYFVELVELPGKPGVFAPVKPGILKRNALPGEIVQLYRNVGFRVEMPDYVLFASADSMRYPYFLLAGELAATGLLFALFGLIQRWRRNRLRRSLSEQFEDG
jgi:hypothetical protein